ncbi:transposase, partial [Streptomyces sp. NPDC056294]|uniref:transposase n=1 Tax=Streptomyces sp. NPDC056294 TaxID=3345773 RepID=UPI0035D64B16
MLPDRTPRRGGRWRDHRQVIDAIAWKSRTGSPWSCLPAEFGSWKGVYTRLRNWALDGTWQRVFTALLAQVDAEGELDWVVGGGGRNGAHPPKNTQENTKKNKNSPPPPPP